MKSIVCLLLILAVFLSGCGTDVTVTAQATVTFTSLSPTETPTPAPTETPTPTPVPGYAIEQLKAMTNDEILALAPEAPAGAVKSLYREAPGMVFYQDPETLNITSAYDLTTAQTYSTPETIPLPPIQRTVGKDILDKNSFENTVANIPKIKDTVLAGEEPFYRLRALQAYRDGLIPNFSDAVQPANFSYTEIQEGIDTSFFKPNNRDPIMADLEKRPVRDAAIVQDGEGGVRFIQVWKQADGSVGVSWIHQTQKAILAKGGGYRLHNFMNILERAFDNPDFVLFMVRDYNSYRTCFTYYHDEVFCTHFMNEGVRANRLQTVEDWMRTKLVPAAIQNGRIQFPPVSTGW